MTILMKAIDRVFPKYRFLPSRVKVLYVATFLGELYLIIPVWMFFYLRFLNYEQIALITIIRQVTSIVLEVPTGAFADLFGKRVTVIMSYIFFATAFVLMPLGTTFLYFAMMEVMIGIARALYSGSFEALTYDSLKEEGLEEVFPTVTSNLVTVSWIAYILAGILGGVLYDLWFGLPYVVLAVLHCVNIILVARYVNEPYIETVKVTLGGYIRQNVEGFKELFANSSIVILTLTLALVTLGYFTAAELLGISQGKQYGFSGTQVGLIFSGGYVVSAVLSGMFSRLLQRFKMTSILLSTTSALLMSFLLARFVGPFFGAMLIMLRISSSSTFSNIRSVVLNKNISSKNRSTALSSFALVYEFGYVVIAYFAGWYMGKHSPNEFAFLLGILLLSLLGLVQMVSFVKRQKTIQSKPRMF